MATALFLDRDGVINEEIDGSYVLSVEEFTLYEGVLEAISSLSKRFDYTIVVTNQRGVGRGLMSEVDLLQIHQHLQQELSSFGSKIDKFYYATSVNRQDAYRKPNVGMALAALHDFPDIDFEQSIMVGNNLSDMQFGKQMGMKTVFLHTTLPPFELPHPLIDWQFPSLVHYSLLYKGDNK